MLHETPISIEGVRDGIQIAAAIQYNDTYTDNIVSYVNNIPTAEGGMHETGFKTALTRVMNEHLRRGGLLKEKDANLSGEDFREGLCAVLALKMQNVQFEGQTKGKLGNPEARPAVEALIAEQIGLYLEDLRNAITAEKVLGKAVEAARVREAARRAKRMAREKTKLEGAPLVGKLASCSGRRASENELFIVEGDSAGGSAKQGRDRRFQAILPLRGKPLNAEKKRLDQVLANEEFRVIIAALGTGIDEDFNIDALKYGKIIILSDADQDGAHIRAILLTFFFRYMRGLITGGHVFIGMPPLYRVTRGKKVEYAYSDRELEEMTRKRKGVPAAAVQRPRGDEPEAALGNDDGPRAPFAPSGDDRGRGRGGAPRDGADGRQGGKAQTVYLRPRGLQQERRFRKEGGDGHWQGDRARRRLRISSRCRWRKCCTVR